MKKIYISLLILIVGLTVAIAVTAWTNPTAGNPPLGGGALYYSGGNVGIGTTSPTRLLTVQGTNNNWFRLGAGSTNSNEFISVFGGNPGAVSGHSYNDAPAIIVPKFLRFFTNASNEAGTGATLTMLLDNNGNVGIGTASPDSNYKLTTSGGGVKAENNSASQPAGYFSNTGGGPAIQTGSGVIKATGGLIIETRTSDPASPTTGQIWLRTDL